MRTIFKSLMADHRGATAVEYGLIATLIVIAATTAIIALATTTTELWNSTSAKVQEASR